jgi:hypothetical protein
MLITARSFFARVASVASATNVPLRVKKKLVAAVVVSVLSLRRVFNGGAKLAVVFMKTGR